jgi:hypothetical protein
MGWTGRVQFLEGKRDFSLFHRIQTISRDHGVSYQIGTGDAGKRRRPLAFT